MKFSIFTVMLPDVPVEQAIPMLQKNGYDGVEWRVTSIDSSRAEETPSFHGNNLCTLNAHSSEEYLDFLKNSTDQSGLEIPNLACYLQCGDLKGTEQAMKMAIRLGAPSIRVGVPAYDRKRTYGQLFQEARTYLQAVQELSKTYGVKGVIEIHMNKIASSPSLAHRLVDGLNPVHIGVIFDPGNMVYEGYEQYRMGLELLGPYLSHVHVKNARWILDGDRTNHESIWRVEHCPVTKGAANWQQVIADLQAVGYDGWLSFEDFSNPGTNDQLLQQNKMYIQSFL